MRITLHCVAVVAALLALVASAASAGCSSSQDGAPDADAGAGDGADFGEASTTYPAYSPPVPQVVILFGGTTLKDFTVVPVVFAADTRAATLQDFLTKYARSPEWASAVAEYGVGKMSIAKTVVLDETPPSAIRDVEIEQWLGQKLDGTHPEWGPSDSPTFAKTVYAIVYPDSTKVTNRDNRISCVDFFGFHYVAIARRGNVGADGGGADASDAAGTAEGGGGDVVDAILYIALPRCTQAPLTEDATFTGSLAHELVEVATDPYVTRTTGGPAYRSLDLDHGIWEVGFNGGEIADLCNVAFSVWSPPSIGYSISRSWSNIAARLYHDPCVPTPPDEPYFNTFIVAPDSFRLFPDPQVPPTKGITVRVGMTKTFDVMLFSDRPTDGPWDVTAFEQPVLPSSPRVLMLEQDRRSGMNGEKLHLSITASSTTPTGTSAVAIGSTMGSKKQTVWFTSVSIVP